ncbi:MAG: acetyl-CoA carboxylase biotin carboxyl carrier protein [Bacteroidota bacterium]
MDLHEIKALIKCVSQSGLAEVTIETEHFKLHTKQALSRIDALPPPTSTSMVPVPPSVPNPTSGLSGSDLTPASPDLVEVKSPMIGTFYRASSPGEAPFVEVGTSITAGQSLCVIEAMKLFNEIEAETPGRIVKILVEDASPVEYDQPLFLIAPPQP